MRKLAGAEAARPAEGRFPRVNPEGEKKETEENDEKEKRVERGHRKRDITLNDLPAFRGF